MKRPILSSFGIVIGALVGYEMTSAADVPDALSSAGPAVIAYKNTNIVAWAGASGVSSHSVWYSAFNGSTWSAQAKVPGASTISAPSLASVGEDVYLATTPPEANDEIDVYRSTTGVFNDTHDRLCDATTSTCAHTQATPALAAAGPILYAAWTTANGAIMYAEFSPNVCPIGAATCPPPSWKISPVPVPNALANPATGPSFKLYDGVLYLAWVTPSGAVEVESATLPLTPASWSTAPVVVPGADTHVAPALGVLRDIEGPNTQTLFAAWTTPASGVELARWNGAAWVPTQSPFPPLPNPATSYSPALDSYEYLAPDEGVASAAGAVPDAAEYIISNDLLVTLNEGPNGHGISGPIDDLAHKIRPGP